MSVYFLPQTHGSPVTGLWENGSMGGQMEIGARLPRFKSQLLPQAHRRVLVKSLNFAMPELLSKGAKLCLVRLL